MRNLVKTRLSSAHYENWWDEFNKTLKSDRFNLMIWLMNKLTTSNRPKFTLASEHDLRSKLSRRDNGSNICVCCELDKEDSVEHLLLKYPLYIEIRDETQSQIMYSSDGFQIDGDDTHRCIMLLRDYGAYVSQPLIIMEMAILLVTFLALVVKTIPFAKNM
eukprot:Awhi_evm1s6639